MLRSPRIHERKPHAEGLLGFERGQEASPPRAVVSAQDPRGAGRLPPRDRRVVPFNLTLDPHRRETDPRRQHEKVPAFDVRKYIEVYAHEVPVTRTIGVVSVARSDYGIYLSVLRRIQNDPS